MKKGKLIVLEGADCSGKSSILERLKIVLPVISNDKFLFSREPGSKLPKSEAECEELRNKVLNTFGLTAEEQTRLFAESRLIHTKEIIEELNKGNNIIVDRYLLSSIFYQGLVIGQGRVYELNKEVIELLKANDIIVNNIVFKISEETYEKRLNKRNEALDALETVEKSQILERLNSFNRVKDGQIDEINMIYKVDANGDDFARICMDVLKIINEITK